MTRHLDLIFSFTIPYDVVVIIVNNSDLQTRIACSQVNKEWAILLRRRVFGPHLRVTVDRFSKLLAAIPSSPSLFDSVFRYTKRLAVIGNHQASTTDDMNHMIFLCTSRVTKAFAKIHSLELEGPLNFTSFASFTKFAHFFPALDMLTISGVKWKGNSSTMHSAVSIPRYHRNLRLCMDLSRTQINTVLLWLLANNTTADVRVLNIDLMFIRGNDRFLQKNSFDNLRTLRLSNINPLLNITNYTLISVLRDQITSTTLEYLTLTIFAHNISHLEQLPWGMICIILTSREEFSRLKQLEIAVLDIESPCSLDEVEQFLREQLAPFAAKDALSITFHDSL